MTGILSKYKLDGFFDEDPKDPSYYSAREVDKALGNYVVINDGKVEGGEHLFQIEPDGSATYIQSDNVISDTDLREVILVEDDARKRIRVAIAHDAETHAQSHSGAVARVDNFDTSGHRPGNGRLACMFAVRKIVEASTGKIIHTSDGTAVFFSEMKTSTLPLDFAQEDIPAGGIVLSPTEGTNIGHVGLLGAERFGGSRLIYSNSSSRANWRQSHTIDQWVDYYAGKGLQVLFFPLPDWQ